MKVLFIDNTHAILPEMLRDHGFAVDYFPDLPQTEYYKLIPEYDGLIIRSKINLDKKVLDSANNLKFIGRVGAGMESIDVEYANSKGILCFNSPEGNRDAVGEQTIGMILSLMNKLTIADKQIRNGIWKRESNRGEELKGKTIGIIGYGNMGSAFAQRLKGFDVNVIAYDKYKKGFGNSYVNEVSMKEIFEESDILSLHIPLTDETSYLVDSKYINNFRKPFRLINTSRGLIVKTDDLVNELKNGKILGAALDVLEYEDSSFEFFSPEVQPEAFKYLISADNVLLSPHIAGWSNESLVKLAGVLASKIINAFPLMNKI